MASDTNYGATDAIILLCLFLGWCNNPSNSELKREIKKCSAINTIGAVHIKDDRGE